MAQTTGQRIGLPQPPDEYDRAWAATLIRDLERKISELDRNLAADYTVTNDTEDRTLDASAADAVTTVADCKVVLIKLLDVLSTLIRDQEPRRT